jgi:hypothetical protein
MYGYYGMTADDVDAVPWLMRRCGDLHSEDKFNRRVGRAITGAPYEDAVSTRIQGWICCFRYQSVAVLLVCGAGWGWGCLNLRCPNLRCPNLRRPIVVRIFTVRIFVVRGIKF